jgi:hypothetical protein
LIYTFGALAAVAEACMPPDEASFLIGIEHLVAIVALDGASRIIAWTRVIDILVGAAWW